MLGQSCEPPCRAHELLHELGVSAGSALHVGGAAVEELVARFGTPLYVHDAEVLRRRLAAVQAAFGSDVRVLFALKAQPLAAVAAVLRQVGAGAELASGGEIRVALEAGFAPEDMQFAGPAKSARELELALELGIGCINLESESEYERLCDSAMQSASPPGIALRVNLAAGVSAARLRMAGACSKFGIDEERVVDFAARIEAEGHCTLLGLHTYLGTQVFDADAWLEGAAGLLRLAALVEARIGRPLATLDFGGGFGVATQSGAQAFDLARAGTGLKALLASAPGGDTRRHYLELGRYLTAPAGVYLTRVLETKLSGGVPFALVDGGMHQHAAAAGAGSVLRRPWPVVVADRPFERAAGSAWRVGGPLCTPQDEFAVEDTLPALATGDVLAFLASGAYGATFSPGAFLGHPAAAELLVDRGTVHVVRERGSYDDALARQHVPPELRS